MKLVSKKGFDGFIQVWSERRTEVLNQGSICVATANAVATLKEQWMEVAKWSVEQPVVQRAIAFARRRKSITTEELVEWDFKHGKQLFTWDDAEGARQHRLYEARKFLNHFSALFQGLRARAFYNIPESEETGVTKRAYYSVEAVAQSEALRDVVLRQIRARLRTLTAELKFWNLTPEEQESVIQEIRVVLGLQVEAISS